MTDYFTATPDPVMVGATLTVCFENADLAEGTSLEVTLRDNEGHEVTKTIQLDENGKGCFEWTVPDWGGIFINGNDSDEHAVTIDPGVV